MKFRYLKDVLTRSWQRKLSALWAIFLILFLLILGIYPGSGGDISQRNLRLFSERSDWWGFMTSFIYGAWPDESLPWQFTLAIIQLSLFLIGMYLLFHNSDSKMQRLIFVVAGLAGFCFVIQIWRDATLFACIILAYGLLVRSFQFTGSIARLMIISSVIIAFFGCLFKPVFSIIIALVWVLTLSKIFIFKNNFVPVIMIGILLFLGPIALDKYLASSFGMVKSHPEQQVMIYDLAKIRCWSGSAIAERQARIALQPLSYSPENFAEICSSLTPAGWDSLHTQNVLTKKSPALSIRTGTQFINFENLRSAWITTIIHNVIPWANIKIIDASQVLFMANSYHAPNFYIGSKDSIWLQLGDAVLRIPMLIVKILDKFRILSLFFSFLFGLAMMNYSYSNKSKLTSEHMRNNKKIWFAFLAVNLTILVTSTFAYLANNGRYILPFILLNYLFVYQQRIV